MLSYATVSQLKEAMPDVAWSDVYDTAGTVLLERASRAIDAYCKRAPGAFAVTEATVRTFDGSGTAMLWVDEMAETPVEVAVAEANNLTEYTVYAATSYYAWPDNAPAYGEPYTRLDLNGTNGARQVWCKGRQTVKVTAKFGFSTVPPDEIVQATIILAVKWFKRGQQAYADTGAISDLGKLTYTRALDPDIETILGNPKFQRVAI